MKLRFLNGSNSVPFILGMLVTVRISSKIRRHITYYKDWAKGIHVIFVTY